MNFQNLTIVKRSSAHGHGTRPPTSCFFLKILYLPSFEILDWIPIVITMGKSGKNEMWSLLLTAGS